MNLTKPDGVTYIEVKTAAQPQQVFRGPSGALLGYAHYRCPASEFPKRLAIFAEGVVGAAFAEYLGRLYDLYKLEITYRTFHANSEELDL